MISTGVIELAVSGLPHDRMRVAIQTATIDLEQGRYVRVRVGMSLPPLWIASVCRDDLLWQVVAESETVLRAWESAIAGDVL